MGETWEGKIDKIDHEPKMIPVQGGREKGKEIPQNGKI